RLKTLGEVHLVAVAGGNVSLNPFDRGAVLLTVDFGAEGFVQLECASWVPPRRLEQAHQAAALGLAGFGMEHQLAGAAQVIADQCPGIEAETRIAQIQIVGSYSRQALQAAAK